MYKIQLVQKCWDYKSWIFLSNVSFFQNVLLSCHICYAFLGIYFQCYMTSNIIRIDIFSLVHISRSCRCHNFVYGNTIMSPFHVGLLWWGRWKDRIKRESMKIPHQQKCLLCPYQLPRHELLEYYFPVSQITLPFKLLLSWKTNEPNFVVLHFQSSLSLPSQQYFLHVCHGINLFIFAIWWVRSPLFLFTLL